MQLANMILFMGAMIVVIALIWRYTQYRDFKSEIGYFRQLYEDKRSDCMRAEQLFLNEVDLKCGAEKRAQEAEARVTELEANPPVLAEFIIADATLLERLDKAEIEAQEARMNSVGLHDLSAVSMPQKDYNALKADQKRLDWLDDYLEEGPRAITSFRSASLRETIDALMCRKASDR